MLGSVPVDHVEGRRYTARFIFINLSQDSL